MKKFIFGVVVLLVMADFGQSFQNLFFKGNFISDLTLKRTCVRAEIRRCTIVETDSHRVP